jgi:hypothetical protein
MGLPLHVRRKGHEDGYRLSEGRSAGRGAGPSPRARKLLEGGENPIAAKRRAAWASVGVPTFGVVADELLAAKKSEWRNEKHQAQRLASLTELARPLRDRRVDEIDTEAVLEVLKPLWQPKPETASRLRGA